MPFNFDGVEGVFPSRTELEEANSFAAALVRITGLTEEEEEDEAPDEEEEEEAVVTEEDKVVEGIGLIPPASPASFPSYFSLMCSSLFES